MRYRQSFSEPLLARIEHKQKRFRIVPGPAAFLCYPLERGQAAFLGTAYATDTDEDFYCQRERPDCVIIKAYRDLGIVKRRIHSDNVAVEIYGVRAIAHRGKVAALDSFFERGFQSLDAAKIVKRLNVAGVLFAARFGQALGLARPRTKLFDCAGVDLVFLVTVEGMRVVER